MLEKIPDYDALWDKHCASFIASVVKGKPRVGFEGKGKVLFAPGGIRQNRPTTADARIHERPFSGKNMPKSQKKTLEFPQRDSMKSTSRKQEESKNNHTVSLLIEELEYLFEENKIEEYYREAYLQAVKKLNNFLIVQFLAREIDNLYNGKSHAQTLTGSIEKRESAIRAVREISSRTNQNPNLPEDPEIRTQMSSNLDRLRIASLTVVEQAQLYRLQLAEIFEASHVPDFIEKATQFTIKYSGQNYLVKMRTDTDFLKFSEFTKVYDFSEEHDPFFLNVRLKPQYATKKAGIKPAKHVRKGSKHGKNLEKRAEEMGIPTALYKRIREANIVLRKEFDRKNQEEKPEDEIDPEILGFLGEDFLEKKELDAIPEEVIEFALGRLMEEHLENILENYISKLPKESQKEFGELKEEAKKYEEVIWLQFSPKVGADSISKKDNNIEEIEGLALIGKSEDSASVILHFSTIHEKNLGDLLKEVVKYIARVHKSKLVKCFLKKIQFENTTKFNEDLISALKITNNFIQSERDETCFELSLNQSEKAALPEAQKGLSKKEECTKIEKLHETESPQEEKKETIVTNIEKSKETPSSKPQDSVIPKESVEAPAEKGSAIIKSNSP